MIKINTCKCQVVALKRDAELVPGGCGGTSDISWGEIVMRDSQEAHSRRCPLDLMLATKLLSKLSTLLA